MMVPLLWSFNSFKTHFWKHKVKVKGIAIDISLVLHFKVSKYYYEKKGCKYILVCENSPWKALGKIFFLNNLKKKITLIDLSFELI